MAFVQIQTQVVPNWRFGGSAGFIRVFASQSFYEQSSGVLVPQGNPQNISSFCLEESCTISGTNFTIPEITLATTTDSSVPNSVYTAILYDSANVPRYKMLSQFFCDLDYFQSPALSSVLVADAGTTSVNENYVYNGQSAGFGYYNPETASVTLFAVVNTGSQWRIYDSAGTNRYHTSSNPEFPWDGTWVTGSGSTGASPVPTVSENAELVVATWEQLTLSNQASATVGAPFQWNAPFWSVNQTKEYVNSLVGSGTTPYANRLVAGKTYLDTDPALSTTPTAVAVNSPRIDKVLFADYGNSLATAIASIGATKTTLVIERDTTLSTAEVIPTTLTIKQKNGALITKSGSGTINFQGIGLTDPQSQVPFFSGFEAGDVTFTGTVYPKTISTELFDTGNASITDRIKILDEALDGKSATFICYPRTITNICFVGTEMNDGHSLYFMPGEYPNTVSTWGGTSLPPFTLGSNSSFRSAEGAIIYDSSVNNNTYLVYTKIEAANVIIEGNYFKGGGGTHNGASSTCIIQNGSNCHIRNNVFDGCKAYNAGIVNVGSGNDIPRNCSIDFNLFKNYLTQNAYLTAGYDCSVSENVFDFANSTGSSNFTPLDIEPNGANDRIEGLKIDNNRINVSGVNQYCTGIIVQGVAIPSAKRVSVTRNRIYGGESYVTSHLSSGIILYGIQGLQCWGNQIYGSSGLAYEIYNSLDVVVRNNDSRFVGDVRGNLAAMYVLGVRDGQVFGNMLNRNTSATNATKIYEAEIERTVTAAASTITSVAQTPRFYDFWDGLTILLNNTAYTVDAWTSESVITTTAPVGTLAASTFAPAAVTVATDVVNIPSHGHNTGSRVRWTNSLSDPPAHTAPAAASTSGLVTYYVIRDDANNVRFASTLANAIALTAIDLTDQGTGTNTITPVLYTQFSNNAYNNNNAGGITLEPGSSLFSDFNRVVANSYAPALVTANQNNYNPGRNAHRVDISTDASRNFTGLTFPLAQVDGEEHEIYNAGAFNIVLQHNITSTAANRFWTNTLADITLLPGQRAALKYNSTIARWLVAAYDVIITATSLPTAIDATKIADGTVTNAEFQRLDATSSIQTQIDTKAPLASPTFTGTATIPTLTVNTAAALATATGTSLAVTGLLKSSGTAGVGYATGAGGTVTQATSKVTAFTLSKTCGQITFAADQLDAAEVNSATWTNTTVAATDVVVFNHVSGGTIGAYAFNAQCGAGSATINIRNITAGNLSEAPVVTFVVIKGVTT